MSAAHSKSMILTLTSNRSLGEESTVNWTCIEDKRWFRTITQHVGTVVMGRKTFDLMNGVPLPNRINYVLTRHPEELHRTEFVIPVTFEQFRELGLRDYCVIGGYEVYSLFAQEIPVIYISIHKNVAREGRTFAFDFSRCVQFSRTESEELIKEIWIQHPYKDTRLTYAYGDSQYLDRAKVLWETKALDRLHPTATVVVAQDKILGEAGNGAFYETYDMCERVRVHAPTGQMYHLCRGNHLPENHSEQQAVRAATKDGFVDELQGSTAYLYGHWWSCLGCTECMLHAGVTHVVYSREWTQQFLGIVV